MTQTPKDDLQHIRQMMERSSRFISLSGLSGVVAGIIALAGAGIAFYIFSKNNMDYLGGYQNVYSSNVIVELGLLAIVVLFAAIGQGIFFTIRKSKKKGLEVWTTTTKNLLLSLFIPVLTGGVFCFAAIYHGYFAVVAPATLIFYGLGLVNAAKYTYSDIEYLGYCQILLGLIAMFLLGYGLFFWILGFGILHIIYGIVMYKKYE